VLATMLDASEAQGRAPRLVDVLGVAGQGLRYRFGLSPDRFGGQLMELCALPGLVMGSAFAIFLFTWGEWIPRHSAAPVGTSFGPFVTVAPFTYLAWILCTIGALAVPSRRRLAASVAVLSAGATVLAGKGVGLSPNVAQMSVLAVMGVPGVLATRTPQGRREVGAAGGAGALTLGLVWLLGPLPIHFETFYWYGNYALNRSLVWVACGALLVAAVSVVLHRPVAAAAVIVLIAPFMLLSLSVLSSRQWVPSGTDLRAISAVALFVVGLGGVGVLWIRDLHAPSAREGILV